MVPTSRATTWAAERTAIVQTPDAGSVVLSRAIRAAYAAGSPNASAGASPVAAQWVSTSARRSPITGPGTSSSRSSTTKSSHHFRWACTNGRCQTSWDTAGA